MTVLVIDVGETFYGKYSLPIIKKLCEHNDVDLYILKNNIPQNIYKLHPSWLKLFAFDLIDDDFIISWDLDLLPTKLYNFKKYFNKEVWNFCYDPSYKNLNFTFNGKFKYNCGLMGIPKQYSDELKTLYTQKGSNSSYPSYEQYHINDKIFDENLKVNLLDYRLNTLFDGNENFSDDVFNIHYTWKINSNQHRVELIEKHFNKYKNNFYL